MGKSIKQTLKDIVLQHIPVTIGVYVGILASNWNEQKKIDQTKSQTIERIKNEIVVNNSKIDKVKDYHIMVMDTILKISSSNSNAQENPLGFWEGLRIP